MCGIVGIVSENPVSQGLYEALTVLQHRGQDAAGMVTCHGRKLQMRKANGLVRDVFQQQHMQRLGDGTVGLAHVRYPTAGSSSSAEAQPMYVNSPYGIAFAHNGNLTNSLELQADLFKEDMRHVNTGSDSEVLLNVFAHELQELGADRPEAEQIFKAVEEVHRRCSGGYAGIALIMGAGIVGFRDPLGIRPLIYGKKETASGVDYMLASESVALDALGYERIRDVKPGEAVFISNDGQIDTAICAEKTRLIPCIFEYVYLARPDSIIDQVSVYKARLRMGEHLGKRVMERFPANDHDIDVVIPIPDTGRTAALPLAHQLNVKYREGFVKNRYIGRTFIMPGQFERKRSVRQKFNSIGLELKGKNVLLVDDSIVRGTTIKQIIQMAREAGARKVYLASAAPPVRYPNVYGIDMPSVNEFVANNKSTEEIGLEIGADLLVYQTLEDLIESAREGNPDIEGFETSVFNGVYVTGDIDEKYLNRLSKSRNDQAKIQEDSSPSEQGIIGLHNHG